MSNVGEAFEAIAALAIGGLIFMVFASALAGTALDGNTFLDFQFWGVLYLLAAIVLAIIVVGGIVSTLFEGL